MLEYLKMATIRLIFLSDYSTSLNFIHFHVNGIFLGRMCFRRIITFGNNDFTKDEYFFYLLVKNVSPNSNVRGCG